MAMDSRQYHNLTSYARDKIPSHMLDWDNQPSTFKMYPGIEQVLLPREVQFGDEKLSDVFKRSCQGNKTGAPSIVELSRILLLAYSIW